MKMKIMMIPSERQTDSVCKIRKKERKKEKKLY